MQPKSQTRNVVKPEGLALWGITHPCELYPTQLTHNLQTEKVIPASSATYSRSKKRQDSKAKSGR